MVHPRQWISLGAWCGPSLILSKMSLRPAAYLTPFDMVRTTMDGILHFTEHRHDLLRCASTLEEDPLQYFPPKRAFDPIKDFPRTCYDNAPPPSNSMTPPLVYTMDPVNIWLLFRGQHTCFTHYDLNNAPVELNLRSRFPFWSHLIEGRIPELQSVVFLRSACAENFMMEVSMVEQFQKMLDSAGHGTTCLDYRFVLVRHFERENSMQNNNEHTNSPARFAGFINDRSCVWDVIRTPHSQDAPTPEAACAHDQAATPRNKAPSLFDRSCDGYETIVRECALDNPFWNQPNKPCFRYREEQPSGSDRLVTSSHEFGYVEEVPAFLGTCKGFGSSISAATGVCMFCGSKDGHALKNGIEDTGSHDTGAVMDLLAVLGNRGPGNEAVDLVACVEAVANAQGMTANRVRRLLTELIEN